MSASAVVQRWEKLDFDPLKKLGVPHAFTLRNPLQEDSAWRESAWKDWGFDSATQVSAEQTHGHSVARVTAQDCGKRIPEVDALISNDPCVTLVIRTADCAPIFLVDPVERAIGLIHSGRKGTEQNILSHTVHAMSSYFACKPSDVVMVLAPCIRVPQYDVDFAGEILNQARSCGLVQVHDCGLNTGADLERFYSYRMEKGNTGRHYSFLRLP